MAQEFVKHGEPRVGKPRSIQPRGPDGYENRIHGQPDEDEIVEELEALKVELVACCKRIQDVDSVLVKSFRKGYEHARSAGLLLLKAKRALAHGEFGKWIESHLPISGRTARMYMQIADSGDLLSHLADGSKRQSSAVLSMAGALKCLPKPIRKPTSPATRGTNPNAPPAALLLENPRSAQRSANRPTKVDARRDAPTLSESDSDTRSDDREVTTPECALDDRSVGGEFEEQPVAASPCDPSSEEEWLRSLPLRSQLADPTVFDQEALLWRKTRGPVEQLVELLGPSDDLVAMRPTCGSPCSRYSHLVAQLIGVRSPDSWRLCARCRGEKTCAKPDSANGAQSVSDCCNVCMGAGYEHTY